MAECKGRQERWRPFLLDDRPGFWFKQALDTETINLEPKPEPIVGFARRIDATLKAHGDAMTIWFAAAVVVAAVTAALLGCLAYIIVSLHRGAALIASRQGRQPLTAVLVPTRKSPPSRRFKLRTGITLSRPSMTLQPAYARVRLR